MEGAAAGRSVTAVQPRCAARLDILVTDLHTDVMDGEPFTSLGIVTSAGVLVPRYRHSTARATLGPSRKSETLLSVRGLDVSYNSSRGTLNEGSCAARGAQRTCLSGKRNGIET